MKVTENTFNSLKKLNICFSRWGGEVDSRIKIGDNIIVDKTIHIESHVGIYAGNTLATMGAYSYSASPLFHNTEIGRYSSIAMGCRFFGYQHPYQRFSSSAITYETNHNFIDEKEINSEENPFIVKANPDTGEKSVKIGNDVWIGSHVALKGGITIGDGAVIATGAIVTKDVPPYEVWGGVPAKCIKLRFPETIINQMLDLKWWRYKYTDFKCINGDIPVEEFIFKITEMVEKGELKPYDFKYITGEEIIKTEKELYNPVHVSNSEIIKENNRELIEAQKEIQFLKEERERLLAKNAELRADRDRLAVHNMYFV